MIIAYGSDIHLNHGDFDPFNRGADTLILAGDIFQQAERPSQRGRSEKFFVKCLSLFKNVIFVKGNHEDYHLHLGASDEGLLAFLTERYSNFHYLENSSVEIDGLTIAGATLWTDQFRGSKHSIARARQFSDFLTIMGLKPEETMARHAESVEFIRKSAADIVVTHHAPCGGSVHPQWAGHPDNGQFYSSLDALILDLSPKLWIHGHMHDPSDYMVGKTRILCNPRGYASERSPRFQWDFKYLEVNK